MSTPNLCRQDTQQAARGKRPLCANEFSTLLRVHSPRVRAYARSLARDSATADDLLQDALLRAWSSRHQFERGTNFRAWLCTIVRNQFLDHWRSRRVIGGTIDIDAASRADVAMDPIQETVLDFEDVARAYDSLRPRTREIIMLAGAMGLSYEETADALGCAMGTVRSRLSRARSELHSVLQSQRPASNRKGRRRRARSSLRKLIA